MKHETLDDVLFAYVNKEYTSSIPTVEGLYKTDFILSPEKDLEWNREKVNEVNAFILQQKQHRIKQQKELDRLFFDDLRTVIHRIYQFNEEQVSLIMDKAWHKMKDGVHVFIEELKSLLNFCSLILLKN